MLTGPGGISRDPAAAAWASLQPVAAQAKVRLSYLAVAGEDSVPRATSFIAVQARQGCDIIVAVGESEVAAVTTSMTAYPHIQFVVVNSDIDAETAGSRVQVLIPRM